MTHHQAVTSRGPEKRTLSRVRSATTGNAHTLTLRLAFQLGYNRASLSKEGWICGVPELPHHIIRSFYLTKSLFRQRKIIAALGNIPHR